MLLSTKSTKLISQDFKQQLVNPSVHQHYKIFSWILLQQIMVIMIAVDKRMKPSMDLLLDMPFKNLPDILSINVLMPVKIIIQTNVLQENLALMRKHVMDSTSGTLKSTHL
jgi:hypothetical protein